MEGVVCVAPHPETPVLVVLVMELQRVVHFNHTSEHCFGDRMSVGIQPVLCICLVQRGASSGLRAQHTLESCVGLLCCTWPMFGSPDCSGCLEMCQKMCNKTGNAKPGHATCLAICASRECTYLLQPFKLQSKTFPTLDEKCAQ